MTQSLHTLLEHTEQLRDQARAALQSAQSAADALHRQAEQLQSYRQEYDARNPACHGRLAPIELLRCHLGFVERLQQAQRLQHGQLQAAQALCTRQREALLALEIRTAAVRKLLERRGQDTQRQSQRDEQRRSDEAAQRSRGLQASSLYSQS